MEKKPNKRVMAKAATRQKAVDAAREAFATTNYNSATIRDLARKMGMSTGAIFANFAGKADLWRASMGCEPPVDDALTRARFAMRDALLQSVATGESFAAYDASISALRLAGVEPPGLK